MTVSASLEILIAILPLEVIYLSWMIYVSYKAFKIRKSSLVPTHRYQALWVGASSIYWIVSLIQYFIVPFLYLMFSQQILAAKLPIALSVISSLYFGVGLTFAWTDAIVPIAKKSDPRNRDTFHWRYVRLIIWGAIFVGYALGTYFTVLPILNDSGTGLLGPVGIGIIFYSQISPFFLSIAITILVILLIVYSQSRDIIFRRHLRWFIIYTGVLGVQAAFVFIERANLSYLTSNSNPGFLLAASIFGTTLAFGYTEAFCLHRCVASLAPLNRFPRLPQESQANIS